MERGCARLTVFAPFWVGAYQREDGGTDQACRIVFGPEPKDYQVYRFLLENWHRLQCSPPTEGERPRELSVNPKRVQRQAAKTLAHTGAGTKAQQALKLQQQEGKAARRRSRQEREARRLALPREKSRKKHKGR